LLHEDNFIEDAKKNGFCGKFKSKSDFAEVKHGYWMKTQCSEKDGNAYCSECNHFDWSDCKYCSKCGAKMKVKEFGEV
jgi:hypothetical protein